MQLELTIAPIGEAIILPLHYHHALQGFIYRNLGEGLATRIHDHGYSWGKRRLKMFVFSRILKKGKRIGEEIRFSGSIRIRIGSPFTAFLESLVETLLKKGRLRLGSSWVGIEAIEILPRPVFENGIKIRAISPITVYSTLRKPDGKKKTYYYSPFEREFSELIGANLKKKFEIVHEKEPVRMDFLLKPERVDGRNLVITSFRGTIIKAWSGIYRLSGEKKILELAYDCGLGSKNSQGFGMIEVLPE